MGAVMRRPPDFLSPGAKGDLQMKFQSFRQRERAKAIAKLEKRIENICFALIVIGLCAMWAFVGWQLNLLEAVH